MLGEIIDLFQPVIVMACVIAFSIIVYGYIQLTIERESKPCQTILKTDDTLTHSYFDMDSPWYNAFEKPNDIQPIYNRDHEDIINISNQS